MDFACGESLCKAAFVAAPPARRGDAVHCPICLRALYPRDVLSDSTLTQLEGQRAVLMRVVNGQRVEAMSRDFAESAPSSSLLDEIADATAAEARPATAGREIAHRPSSKALWIVLLVLVLACAVVAYLVLR